MQTRGHNLRPMRIPYTGGNKNILLFKSNSFGATEKTYQACRQEWAAAFQSTADETSATTATARPPEVE